MAVLTAMFLFAAPAGWAAETPSLALVRPGSPWLPPDGEPASAASTAENSATAPSNTNPRATKQGMKIGAITGAVTGAALFPLGLALAEALCESSPCENYNVGSYVLAGVVGAGLFGLAGAGIGALIGSAFHGESPSSEPGSASPPSSPQVSRPSTNPGSFGSLVITMGVDALTETESTTGSSPGMTADVALLANFAKGRLSVVPESGYKKEAARLFSLGGLAEILLTDTGLRPYGVFGMGWDNWTSSSNFGGASLIEARVGAGLRYRLGSSGTDLQLESRYSWPLQNIDEPGDFSYVTVTFGPRFSW